MSTPAPGCQFVILGANGDLTQRMLLPALYEVVRPDQREEGVRRILGCGRRPLDDAGFRKEAEGSLVASGVASRRRAHAWCHQFLEYQCLEEGSPEGYGKLSERLQKIDRGERLAGNRVFYLALPAVAFPAAIEGLGGSGLNRSRGWTRLVIEKPFGRDLASARKLNELVHRYFDERQVFRIDHYLGKETVQNLLVFRFANMLFESAWNRDRIDHVEITVAESLGVEHRARYYETAGALRDMVQNHLTQLLMLTAMEVPSALESEEIRNEKVKVLRSLEPLRPRDAVFGQYTTGRVGETHVPGYREEPDVDPRSKTETFVALRLRVNNWRWHGIPFLLRTGKRLPAKSTRIVVHFRSPPVWLFRDNPETEVSANTLTITVQPDEGFELAIEIKRPGHAVALETHRMHFQYSEAFGPLADAYQTLLMDVVRGDQTLFVRADEVEESWRVYAPLIRKPPKVHPYSAGTWGPKEADGLAARGGHRWSET